MPTLADYRAEIETAHQSKVLSEISQFSVHAANLWNFFETGIGSAYNKSQWQGFISDLTECIWWIVGFSSVNYQFPITKWMELAETGIGGTVDMDAIINAMLAASFDELQNFIGLVDAYRVALWNAPFNADFYAALARGFQTWPQY